MKMNVTLTIEVDQDAWEATYGTGKSDQRDDVKSYVLGLVQGSAATDEGAITKVVTK